MEVLRRVPRPHRRPGGSARRRHRASSVSGTTRSSSTSWVTTDRRPRGRCTARGALRPSRTASPRTRSGCWHTSTTSVQRRCENHYQRRLGVGAGLPRSSGPSRSPHTSVAPATAWRSRGRDGIEVAGGLRTQFHHVIDLVPTILDAAGIAEPTSRQRRRAEADRGCQHALQLRRRRRCEPTHHPVLRDPRQSGASTTTAGWPPASTVACRGSAVAALPFGGPREVGALQHRRRLQPGPRPGRRTPGRSSQSSRTLFDRKRGATTSIRLSDQTLLAVAAAQSAQPISTGAPSSPCTRRTSACRNWRSST